MQSWALAAVGCRAARDALCGLIDGVGRRQFAAAALAQLGPVFDIGSWSAYRLFGDRPPVLHLSASRRPADTTGECFAIYRDDGIYRTDTSFAPATSQGAGRSPVMLRMSADEIANAPHREAIYVRHGMVERLSVARSDADGSVLAVNLYRHTHQGRFAESQVAQFGDVAAALIAAVARHVEWVQPAGAGPTPRELLRRRCAALTERELDVLERLLQGMTYDGIASDMGVSLGSVKTYRARAFERLDIHFRSELFASIRVSPVDLSADSASG